VLAAAGLTALTAQIAVPIPGSPVPVTGQTFAVLLTAAALGPVRGALGQVVYLLAAMFGFPVMANGGGGVEKVFGATGGYLFGFVLAAVVVGSLAKRGTDRKPVGAFFGYVIGSVIIYAIGAPVLGLVTDNSLGWAIQNGVVPFLFGDLLKALLAAGLLPLAWLAVRKSEQNDN
jgi:biotin transport system substrate-specific component